MWNLVTLRAVLAACTAAVCVVAIATTAAATEPAPSNPLSEQLTPDAKSQAPPSSSTEGQGGTGETPDETMPGCRDRGRPLQLLV